MAFLEQTGQQPTDAAVLSRIAPHLIGLAGYVYFLIGIAEWALGDYNGRLRRRVAANTTDTSPA